MTPHGTVVASFERPRGRATSFAVFSDMHVAPDHRGTWKVFHHAEDRFRTAVQLANRIGVDAALLLGDLTKDGHPLEFDRVDDVLDDLAVPFVAVPGNHDVPKTFDEHHTPSVEDFIRRYTPGNLPYHVRFGDVDVVGLNSATTPDGDLEDTHAGGVSDDQYAWLESVLPECDQPLVCLHHPLSGPDDHVAGSRLDQHHGPIENAGDLAALLAAHDALVLSGHIHWPAVGRHPGLRELSVPATCSIPQSFLHLTVDQTGTTARIAPVADSIGVEEAYQYASAGTPRSKAIAERVVDGYLDTFPLVSETGLPTDPRPTPLTRPID